MAPSVLLLGYELTPCDLEVSAGGIERASTCWQQEPFRTLVTNLAGPPFTALVCTKWPVLKCREGGGALGESTRTVLAVSSCGEQTCPYPMHLTFLLNVLVISSPSRMEQGPVVLEGCRREAGFHVTLVPGGCGVGGRALLLSMNQQWQFLSLAFKSCILLWPFPAVPHGRCWGVTGLSLSQVLEKRRTKWLP